MLQYNSLVNVSFTPKKWTPVEGAIWRSAFIGNREVVFENTFNEPRKRELDTITKRVED